MSSMLIGLLIFLAMMFGASISFVLFAFMVMVKGTKADQLRSDRDQIEYLKDWQQRRRG